MIVARLRRPLRAHLLAGRQLARLLGLAACVLGCQLLGFVAHLRLIARDEARPSVAPGAVAPATWRRLALTYRPLMADVFYLRAVNAFGSKAEGRRHYPTVAPLLEAAASIDPTFAGPYLLAGMALPFAGNGAERALALLAKGTKVRSDLWRLHFFYGFLLSQAGRPKEAALALAKAVPLAGVPPYVAPLATRMAAEGSDPALGLALLNQFADQISDPGVLAALAERRAPLVYQLELDQLRASAKAFAAQNGFWPRDVAQLRPSDRAPRQAPAGGLPSRDPWGAPYRLLPGGEVDSSNHHKLLHVFVDHPAPTRPP